MSDLTLFQQINALEKRISAIEKQLAPPQPESVLVAEVVFYNPGGDCNEGLLDVPAEDTRFVVKIFKRGDVYRLDAEAVDIKSGGSDGWYSFLETFVDPETKFWELAEAIKWSKNWATSLGVKLHHETTYYV